VKSLSHQGIMSNVKGRKKKEGEGEVLTRRVTEKVQGGPLFWEERKKKMAGRKKSYMICNVQW